MFWVIKMKCFKYDFSCKPTSTDKLRDYIKKSFYGYLLLKLEEDKTIDSITYKNISEKLRL